jgi:hypothetical protein
MNGKPERMSPATKAWLGAAFVGAAIAVYAWRGLPGGWDFAWHGGLFLMGLGLLMPQFFPGTLGHVAAVLKIVFGRFTVMPGNGSPQDRDQ